MTTLPWFRLYGEIVDDEKIRLLAFEDRWHYVAVLCCKSRGLLDKGEDEDLRRRKLALKLGLSARELDEVARRLSDVGLVDRETLQPLAWDERQMRSDSSKDRVARYRERRAMSGLDRGSSGYLKHRAEVMARDESSCVYCRATDDLCLDHMLPIALGGTDDIDNLATACKKCNSGKSGRTPEQAGYAILSEGARNAYMRYLAKRVTVTVTAQDTDTEEDKDKKKQKHSADKPPKVSKREQAENWPLPDWIDRDAWKEWIGSRTKPMAGVDASIRKLAKWKQQGHDPNAILFDCASNGYQGLFLTNNLSSKGASNGNEPTDFFSRRRGESLVEHATRINRYHDERERAAASQQAAPHLGAHGGDLWSSVDDAHGRIPAGRGWVIDHGG